MPEMHVFGLEREKNNLSPQDRGLCVERCDSTHAQTLLCQG